MICLSFSVSYFAYADNLSKFCSNLDIFIINNTPNTCFLLYSNVTEGMLLHKKSIMRLPSHSVSMAFVESYGESDAQLTYACGKGMATIHMIKKSCLEYMNYIEVRRLIRWVGRDGLVFEKESPFVSIGSMADMDVTYEVMPRMYGFLMVPTRFYNSPACIFWKFE